MTWEIFWAHVSSMSFEGEDPLRALATSLRAETPEAIMEFRDRLSECLFRLDTERHAGRRVRDRESGEELVLSDDLFLFVRCAVVAAGRATYERVLNDPAALDGEWELLDADRLPEVPDLVYASLVGEDPDRDPTFDLETRSNAAEWPGAEPMKITSLAREWLVIGIGWWALTPGPEFPTATLQRTIYAAKRRILARTDLRDFFTSAGAPVVSLFLSFMSPQDLIATSSSVRVNRVGEWEVTWKTVFDREAMTADLDRWADDLLRRALEAAIASLIKRKKLTTPGPVV